MKRRRFFYQNGLVSGNKMETNKALFLDRDGVVNEDRAYVSKIEDFVFIPGIFPFLRCAQDKGYLLIIVTNQAGIARGYYSENDYHILTAWMLHQFEIQGITIQAVYYCPHHPKCGIGDYKVDCSCRKPNPGMLLRGMEEFGVDMSKSVLIGDKDSDLEAGRRAAVGKLLLLKGEYKIHDVTDVIEIKNLGCGMKHL